jgi:hypothetical protein
LCCQMKYRVRSAAANNIEELFRISDVTSHILDEDVRDVSRREMAGDRWRFERVTCNFGTKAVQPKCQPRTLKSSMSRHEDGSASKVGQVVRHSLLRFTSVGQGR